jgi:Replication-relaxation
MKMLHLSHMQKEKGRGIDLQERDFALLRGLYESRVMKVSHIAALVFEGKLEAARKRIQKLKKANLILERVRGHSEPAALQLSKKGFEILIKEEQLQELPRISEREFMARCRVSSLTIQHELAVMDVRVALETALLRTYGVRILQVSTWPLLSQFSTRMPDAQGYGATETVVKPDGFLCFRQQLADGLAEHSCFIEVDRGTESLHVLTERACCYRNHYRSGGFAESRGGTREQFEDFPFRVLVIFKSSERRNNFGEQLLSLNPPIKTMVWLTTIPELIADPLGPIWVRPVEYKSAIGSGRDSTSASRLFGKYRRQIERDSLVEETIIKDPLLAQ